MRAVLPLVLSLGFLGCSRGPLRCDSWLELTGEPVTAEQLALPAIAHIHDTGLISKSGDGCEYGSQLRRGTLGPFAVEYDVWDYKGQAVTTGTGARIFDPACPRSSVSISMGATVSGVELKHDAARDVYIIDTRGNQTPRAIAVRRGGKR